jgi:asparagine synthase (glutamine-hydrolysing)
MLLAPGVGNLDPYSRVRHHFDRPDIPLEMEKILRGDMATYLSDDILVKVDRMTMATSLESRAPLLDHQLIEFAARIPFEYKLREGSGKYLLKKVAQNLLPAAIMQKRKQGFAIPVASWLRNALKPLLLDTLSSQAFRERGIFNAQGIRHCVDSHMSGAVDYSEQLWLLLTYEMWAKRFVDAPTSSPSF